MRSLFVLDKYPTSHLKNPNIAESIMLTKLNCDILSKSPSTSCPAGRRSGRQKRYFEIACSDTTNPTLTGLLGFFDFLERTHLNLDYL